MPRNEKSGELSITCEIKRNSGQRGYRHNQADRLAQARKQCAVTPYKMTPPLINIIEQKLRLKWSSEQISGWLARKENTWICHETIYRYLWDEKHAGGDLYLNLRHKIKGNRRRGQTQDSRGKIPNRVSIHDRPSIVDTRERVGDWEIDLIIGKGHSGALLTIVERSTRNTVATRINDKTANSVTAATLALPELIKQHVLTNTADNRKEYSGPDEIAKALKCDVYFADAYSSWQREANENTNGLLRQYWPKNTDFKNVPHSEVNHVLKQLNDRLRKVLGYQIPADRFLSLTSD